MPDPLPPSPAATNHATDAAVSSSAALSLTELLAAVLVAACGAGAAAALATAGLGSLSPAAAAGAALLAAGFVAALAWRACGRPTVGWSEGAVALLLLLGMWRAWPAATPWPVFLDASWYVNTAAKIAETGGLRFPVPALELPEAARAQLVSTFRDQRAAGLPFPDDAGQGFHAVAFAMPDVGRAEALPYHPPLYAAWLAAWRAGGPGMGWGVMAWTLAWLLAVAALARRSFGPVAAPVAAGLLALGPALLYYGRLPYAEPAAAALAVIGTWALARLAGGRPRPGWAAAAGLALGGAFLVKVDAVWAIAAGLAWWALARRRAGGWTEGLGLALGLGLPLAWFALLAATVSRLYVTLNGGGVLALVREQWLLALALALAAAGLAGLAWAWRQAGRGPGAVGWRRAVGVAAAVFLALGMVRGWLAPEGTPPGMVAILAWLVTPLGLWAAVSGLIWALERAEAAAGPVLAQALLAGGLVLAAPVVTQTLSPLYAGRRLVPMALAATVVLAGGTMEAWWRWRARPPAGAAAWARWLDVAAVGGLLLVAAGLWLAGADRLAALSEFAGGETLARRVAADVGEGDVLLFPSTLRGADPGRMAAAVWALTGRRTAVVGAPDRDPAAVAQAVDAWRAAGRAVYYVTDNQNPPPEVPGYILDFRDEESVVTYALAPFPSLPPTTRPVDLQLRLFAFEPEGGSR